MNRAEELTDAHWDYIEKLLTVCGVSESEQFKISFHYKTAMFHGYNHGWEDAKNDKS